MGINKWIVIAVTHTEHILVKYVLYKAKVSSFAQNNLGTGVLKVIFLANFPSAWCDNKM